MSLEVPDGSLTCLMGRNGVGKTTLLNTVMGLLPARSGSIRLDGEDITRLTTVQAGPPGHRLRAPGPPGVPAPDRAENLTSSPSTRGSGDPTAIDDALDLFPALATMIGRPAGLLSGGQAPAAGDRPGPGDPAAPAVLDEPTEGIQPSIIMEIEDAIAQLHRSTAMSILLVEQYVEFALRLAERYAVMDGGRIEASGAVADADLARVRQPASAI